MVVVLDDHFFFTVTFDPLTGFGSSFINISLFPPLLTITQNSVGKKKWGFDTKKLPFCSSDNLFSSSVRVLCRSFFWGFIPRKIVRRHTEKKSQQPAGNGFFSRESVCVRCCLFFGICIKKVRVENAITAMHKLEKKEDVLRVLPRDFRFPEYLNTRVVLTKTRKTPRIYSDFQI